MSKQNVSIIAIESDNESLEIIRNYNVDEYDVENIANEEDLQGDIKLSYKYISIIDNEEDDEEEKEFFDEEELLNMSFNEIEGLGYEVIELDGDTYYTHIEEDEEEY